MGDTVSLQAWMNRATAFELLAHAYLLPTRELAEALTSGDYAAACDEVAEALSFGEDSAIRIRELLATYEGLDAQEVFHELRHEHTHLFIGEKRPPITPYAGVWAAEQNGQQGLLFVGRKTIEIEHFMVRCGVAKDLAAGHTNDPVDHVGTMCEFAKFLCLVNAEAIQVPQGAAIEKADFDLFVGECFSGYAKWLAAEVSEKARTPFFQAAACLLGAVDASVASDDADCC